MTSGERWTCLLCGVQTCLDPRAILKLKIPVGFTISTFEDTVSETCGSLPRVLPVPVSLLCIFFFTKSCAARPCHAPVRNSKEIAGVGWVGGHSTRSKSH
jgi:hypothetical protein